jgi:hypothetical protein
VATLAAPSYVGFFRFAPYSRWIRGCELSDNVQPEEKNVQLREIKNWLISSSKDGLVLLDVVDPIINTNVCKV